MKLRGKFVAGILVLTAWAGSASAADYIYTPTTYDLGEMQHCLDMQQSDVRNCAVKVTLQIFAGVSETLKDVLDGRSTEHTRMSPQLTDVTRHAIVACGADKMTSGATYSARVIDALENCMAAEGGKMTYAISSALVRASRRR